MILGLKLYQKRVLSETPAAMVAPISFFLLLAIIIIKTFFFFVNSVKYILFHYEVGRSLIIANLKKKKTFV